MEEQALDDSPDKLRRNVMLIGTIIIATILYDFTLKTSGSILGIIEIGNISPLKIWLSLLALLIYFHLRYIYSDQVSEDRKKMKTGTTSLRIRATYQLLHKQIDKYLKKGNQPSCITTTLPPLGLYNRHLRPAPPKFKIIIDTLENDCSRGTVTVKHEQYAATTNAISIKEHNNLNFTIPNYLRIKILITTAARTLTISKSSVDFVAPLLISLVGFLACIYKIASLLILPS
jgi:hypothetical protein